MDLRDAFFDKLYDLTIHDENFYFLTADMWAFSLGKYKENMGDRFINTGISEQNMISVAAGLAKSGKKVCVYTITPFVTERCFEQIKVDLCCMNLPVMIVGIGAGLTYSYDGPTHHTPYDISIMRSLPNLTIYSPSDPVLNSYVAQKAYENKGPTYIRLDKGDYEEIYDGYIAPDPKVAPRAFEDGMIGPYGGCEIAIFSTGTNVYDVVMVAERMNTDMGIHVAWRDVFRVKPFNKKAAARIIKESKKVVVVEEQSCVGGLGSIISETMVEYGICRSFKHISLPDEFCKKYGDRDWIKKQYGLDKDSIVKTVLEFQRGCDE